MTEFTEKITQLKNAIENKINSLITTHNTDTSAHIDIRNSQISYGQVDNTSTSTIFTATVPNLTSLIDGATVMLRNGVVTSAEGFTLNVNGLGAKPVYNSMADSSPDTTIFNISYTMLFVYDSTRITGGCWICYRGYNSNTNTIGYQIRTNSMKRIATDKGYKYRLWLETDDNEFMPVNLSTSTNATANRSSAMNTREFWIGGEILYNGTNGTTNANAELSASTLWQQITFTLGYSFNNTGSALVLSYPSPVYMVATPTNNGKARLTAPYYTQTLPSSENGLIYIYLGHAYSTTAIELTIDHPIYEYKDGNIRLYRDTYTSSEVDTLLNTKSNTNHTHTGYASTSDIPTKTSDLSNDSGFLTSHQDITGKEDKSNKVTSITSSSTDTQYPSAKSVYTGLSSKANSSHTHTKSQITDFPTLSTVATSGSYNDLSNKPTIPSVPSASTTTPKADTSSGAVGTGTTWAKADHIHPKSSIYAEASHTHSDYNKSTYSQTIASSTSGAYEIGKITVDGTVTTIYGKDTNTVYTHPTVLSNALTSGLYKITVDKQGHITTGTNVTKSDITALGIPSENTVYTHPTYDSKSNGLYKITVDSTGHVSATSNVSASDLPSHTHSQYLTSHQDISGKEDTSNKVTSLSSSSTDTQYPSAKSVYNTIMGNVITDVSDLTDNNDILYGQLEGKYDSNGRYLQEVAFTGKTSDLINDSNFVNLEDLENTGTFTELQTLINNANDGDVITLTKDYKNTGSESSITISSGITINGSGYTIDADGNSGIFYIEAYGGEFNILNTTFANAINNGAIDINYDIYATLLIENCVFKNNARDVNNNHYGSRSGTALTIRNSIFENSTQYSIYHYQFNGDCYVYDSVFINTSLYAEDYKRIYLYNCQLINSSVTNGRYTQTDYLTTHQDITGKENTSNKVTSWSSTTTNGHYPSEKLVKDSLDDKQNNLVSGTNIKTINNESLLGSGDITIQGGGEFLIPSLVPKSEDSSGKICFAEATSLTFDDIYPVGSIYMSVNSTSPSTLFGGTWEQIKDKFLLSSGDTYSNGSTGGEATHTLTTSEMPSHNHSTGSHSHKMADIFSGGSEGSETRIVKSTNRKGGYQPSTEGASVSINNTGGGQAHNNMPPYLTVNVWKRTA